MTDLTEPSSFNIGRVRDELSAMARAQPAVLWGLWLIGFGIFSTALPRDMSYDVLHYHIHNGWSFVSGRYGQDFAPANMHSFLNPYMQALLWGLMERLPGPLVAFLLGMLHALAFPAIYWFVRNLTRAAGLGERALTCLFIAFAGFTAEPMFKVVASVRNDHLGATAFFVAMALVISPGPRIDLRRFALAGLVLGLMIGLKPTNGVYAIGLAMFVLLLVPGLRAKAGAVMSCAAGGLAGIVASGGAWYWTLWRDFGNPLYPTLQSVFQSPQGPTTEFIDYVRVPQSALEALTLPFRAAFDGLVVNWYASSDLRIALMYSGAVILLAVIGLRWVSKRPLPKDLRPRPLIALSASMLAMLIVWIFAFATHRYAMALWCLGPLFAYLVLRFFAPGLSQGAPGWGVALAGALALVVSTQYPKLYRQGWTSWNEPYAFAAPPDGFEDDGAFVFFSNSPPTAFAAMAFPQARLGHIPARDWQEFPLENYRPKMVDAFVRHDGPGWVVINTFGGLDVEIEMTERTLPVRVDRDDCQFLRTSMDSAKARLQVCRLIRRPAQAD